MCCVSVSTGTRQARVDIQEYWDRVSSCTYTTTEEMRFPLVWGREKGPWWFIAVVSGEPEMVMDTRKEAL